MLSQLLMEVDEEGNPRAYYVYGLGLIGREDASGRYVHYHYDRRGSTVRLTDEAGNVTDRYRYGAYGELLEHEGSTEQPFRYNGRDGVMTDPNGLYYMRARYYNPEIKRFVNRDIVAGNLAEG
ncbi:Rhs family protein, partial [Paenibacillus popilliae ATCC 14706]